jgi:outer membrane receptor protein involved in Fe transport
LTQFEIDLGFPAQERVMARGLAFLGGILLFSACLSATIFSSISGLVHDPEHRPIENAKVTLSSDASDWSMTATSDRSGQFRFQNVPLGSYTIKLEADGFTTETQNITVASDTEVRLHFPLEIAGRKESVEVRGISPDIDPSSSAATTVIERTQIAETPGASQTNSLAMITDYVPGAYVVHDQLHIRGGHQVSWMLDGVPVPNTSIASNVGAQFDPKDIDSIEVQRGGYSAEYGERAYGVFNVVTRSGFERNRQAELVASLGSYNSTNDQISFGDHTERLAYYGSLTGYRTDLGLETPVPQVINDQAAGLGAFTSLIFNKDPNNQIRLIASSRGDHYQVPIDPSNPLHDVDDERDSFVNFTWLHSLGTGMTLAVSPFYHFNRAHYIPGSQDPVLSEYDRGSNYVGGISTMTIARGNHNFHAGVEAFAERDNLFYSASPSPFQAQRTIPTAGIEAAYLEEQYRATSWLTLNGGLRLTHYGGPVDENSADPRVGAAVQVPHLGWVFRAFYGRYYQPPPLVTVDNPTLGGPNCQNSSQCFVPLRGERDEQREFGLAIPFQGWTFDVSNFRTGARNFFDHDALENSNVFFPLTLAHARVRGWEGTVKSPKIAGRATAHLVYSHQYAEWSGIITGGLIGGDSCDTLCFLDHDQRNTLGAGFDVALPWRASAGFQTNYGSGFLNGDGPAHLPAQTTFDLTLSKSFGENVALRFTALNLSNNHYLLDNSNTFGGTHYVNPREISGQLTYRFKY